MQISRRRSEYCAAIVLMSHFGQYNIRVREPKPWAVEHDALASRIMLRFRTWVGDADFKNLYVGKNEL